MQRAFSVLLSAGFGHGRHMCPTSKSIMVSSKGELRSEPTLLGLITELFSPLHAHKIMMHALLIFFSHLWLESELVYFSLLCRVFAAHAETYKRNKIFMNGSIPETASGHMTLQPGVTERSDIGHKVYGGRRSINTLPPSGR